MLTKSYKKNKGKGSKRGGKKKKTWTCKEGCKTTNTPCKHLEALIQSSGKDPQFESVNRYTGSNVDRAYYESGAGYILPEGFKDRSYEMLFRKKLQKAGLEPVKVEVLVLKYVYNMSFREISRELSVLSVSTSVRLHKEAIDYLKKVGFSK